MLKRIIIAGLLSTVPLFAQYASNFVTSPVFQALDQNGQSVPLGQLCSYEAGTLVPANLFTDPAGMVPTTQPVVMNGGGWAQIYGNGNYKLVLTQPSASTSCPTSGAVIWTYDDVFILSASPSFQSVTATSFISSAIGGTAAFQVGIGTYKWTGAGNITANTVTATTAFTSDSTGSSNAFIVSGGAWKTLGNGNEAGQTSFFNQFQLNGYAGNPSCAACTAPVAGSALISYNTTLGGLQYNLGDAGWVPFAVTPTTANGIVYVSSSALTNSSAFTYSSGNVALTGSGTNGFSAPVFTSTNSASTNPTDPAFATGLGEFQVLGKGAVAVTQIGSSFTSSANTDLTGTLTLSGGTVSQAWPSGRTYTANPICVANDFTGVHAISVGASTTGLVINGNSTDVVQYICAFTKY